MTTMMTTMMMMMMMMMQMQTTLTCHGGQNMFAEYCLLQVHTSSRKKDKHQCARVSSSRSKGYET